MIDVTMENFEADVIAASQTTPVLVDFWAQKSTKTGVVCEAAITSASKFSIVTSIMGVPS